MLRLYYTDAAALAVCYDAALALLPPARRERTARCRFPAARYRMAAAGLLLRAVLGVISDEQLVYDACGKPSLAAGGAAFSLSHGGDLAVLAVGDAALGVDAEPRGRSMQGYYLAGVLTPEELAAHARGAQPFAWFWTRKEAVMKATGLGLRLSPARIDTLPDCLTAQGLRLHLQTQELAGHVVSLAAQTDEAAEAVYLPLETLLTQTAEQPLFSRKDGAPCLTESRERGMLEAENPPKAIG